LEDPPDEIEKDMELGEFAELYEKK